MPNPSMMFSLGFAGATDNPTPARNVYPTAPGGTLGTAAGPSTAVSTSPLALAASSAAAGSGAVAATPTMSGVIGQPLTWWATIVALFIVLGFVAKRAGNAGEFSNVKLSAYNILMITLAAIIGITSLKVIFTKWAVPGITPLIQAV